MASTPEANDVLRSAILYTEELFQSYSYVRPLPAQIISENQPFLDQVKALYGRINQNTHEGPPTWVLEFAQAHVCRSVIYVRTDAGFEIVSETHLQNDRKHVGLVSTVELEQAFVPIRDNDTEYFYLGSVGSFNYGHWLIDDLPRVKAFDAIRARFPNAPIMIVIPGYSKAIDQIRAEGIRAYLHSASNFAIQVVDPETIMQFDRLHYCSPVSNHPLVKSPGAVNRMVARLTSANLGSSPLIFVNRHRDLGRSLVNIGLIRFRLEMLGFQSIDPETLSFEEQRERFSNAQVVVGCMGAAMTNTVFSRPGTKLLYLAPDGWIEPFYWDLAAVRGQSYSVVYGRIVAPSPDLHMSSYSIPWEVIAAALSLLCVE